MNVASILKKIINKNSTLSPTILIDEEGVFEDYIQELEEVRLMNNPLNESEANTTRILYFRGVVSFVFNWKVFAEH